MVSFQIIERNVKRKYGQRLIPNIILITYFIVIWNWGGEFDREGRYLINFAFLLAFTLFYFLNVKIDVEEIEKLRVDSDKSDLSVFRDGILVYKIKLNDVLKIWFEPSKYLKRRLVVKESNMNEHAFNLPLFSKVTISKLDQLVIEGKKGV